VEATMIEAALNAAAEVTVEYGASGTVLTRAGNRGPYAAPQNVYQCAGHEQWVAIAVATDEQWDGLRSAMGDPEWARDRAFATDAGRRAAHDLIDDHLATWTKDQDVTELADLLASAGVPAGVVVDARDIASNPQLLHRNFFEPEHHPISGEVRLPAGAWKFASNHEPWVRRAAPTLGQHNDEVLRELLGLSDAELDRLRADGIIGEMPKGA
jgi:crotonobetainyl-CoA:carnitine CoA-transferase CaiB-like acyl-CoA transferase